MNILGQFDSGSLRLIQVLSHMECGHRVHVRFLKNGYTFCQTLKDAKSALLLCARIKRIVGYHPTVVSILAKCTSLGPVIEIRCV